MTAGRLGIAAWIEYPTRYLQTQNWSNPVESAPRRPFDITRDVTLECPACKVYKTVDRPADIPKNVRLIAIICPDCDDGDFHEETWFSAPGIMVLPTHCTTCGGTGRIDQTLGGHTRAGWADCPDCKPEPDPDRLRDDRDERRRLEREFPYAE